MDSRRESKVGCDDLDQCDTDDDGQWLTYVQLAEKRGVTLRAVMRQAQRQKLRRQPGNDGKTLVWVPRDMSQEHRSPRSTDARSDRAGDVAVAVAALERAHERELATKDELIAGLRRDAAELRGSVMRAELQASVAAERLQQMEWANAARLARGRLRAAWRALRGR